MQWNITQSFKRIRKLYIETGRFLRHCSENRIVCTVCYHFGKQQEERRICICLNAICLDICLLNIYPMSIFFFPSPLLPPESQLFVTVSYWKLVVVVITLEGVEKMAIREGVVPRQTFWLENGPALVLSSSCGSNEQTELRTVLEVAFTYFPQLHFISSCSSYPSLCSSHTGLGIPRRSCWFLGMWSP